MIDALIKQAQLKIKDYQLPDRFCIITIAKELPQEIDQICPPSGVVLIVGEDEVDYYYYSNLYDVSTKMPTDRLAFNFVYGDMENSYIKQVFLGELSDFEKVLYYNFYGIKGKTMLKSIINNIREDIEDDETEIRVSVNAGELRLIISKNEVNYMKLGEENEFIFGKNEESFDKDYVPVFKEYIEDYIEQAKDIKCKIVE